MSEFERLNAAPVGTSKAIDIVKHDYDPGLALQDGVRLLNYVRSEVAAKHTVGSVDENGVFVPLNLLDMVPRKNRRPHSFDPS